MKAQFLLPLFAIAAVSFAQGDLAPKKAMTIDAQSKPMTMPSADKIRDFERFKEFERFKDFGYEAKMAADKLAFDMNGKKWQINNDLAFAFQGRGRGGEDQGERLYERGKRALDNRKWDEAVVQFEEAAASSKTIADGALYWKAYALMKLGRGKEATAVLDDLAKQYPQSRWLNDAKAMRVEIAQTGGRPVSPESAGDDDLKIMALNGLIHSDSERAIPLLEKILTNQSSHKLRERALFVLSQSNSPAAREVLTKIAKGGANPDLQMQAIRTLGVHGGKESRQALADIYAASVDVAIKKQILNSFMVSGERDRLLNIAKSEPNQQLRMSAIHYLGTMGATSQLATMYGSEQSTEVRGQIIQAMMISGNSQKLIEIAKTEKDQALRMKAISLLGTMNQTSTGPALAEIYTSNSDTETRKKVLTALFVQNNAKQLVEVARKETNSDLKRTAVQHLSNMRNKEATDYLMEILK